MIGERERVKFALEYVKRAKERSDSFQGEFRNLAQRLPAMIVNSGVLLTVAFIRKNSVVEGSGGESSGQGGDKAEANKIMLSLLTDWLKKVGILDPGVSEDSILDALLDLTPTGLMYAHDELLRLAEPLKLLAEAALKGGGP